MTPQALDRGNAIVKELADIENMLAMEQATAVAAGAAIRDLLVQQKADRIAAMSAERTALQAEFAAL